MAGDGGPVPSLTVTPAERSPLSQGGLSPSSPRTQVAGQPCLLAPCHVHSPASSPGGCPLPDTGPLATHDSCPPRQRRAGSQAFLLNMHSQYPLANRGGHSSKPPETPVGRRGYPHSQGHRASSPHTSLQAQKAAGRVGSDTL